MAWDQIQEVQGALVFGDRTFVHHSPVLDTGQGAERWWCSGCFTSSWTHLGGQRHHVHVQVSVSRCPRGQQPSDGDREARSRGEAKVPRRTGN